MLTVLFFLKKLRNTRLYIMYPQTCWKCLCILLIIIDLDYETNLAFMGTQVWSIQRREPDVAMPSRRMRISFATAGFVQAALPPHSPVSEA